jgi:hypothetical protein
MFPFIRTVIFTSFIQQSFGESSHNTLALQVIPVKLNSLDISRSPRYSPVAKPDTVKSPLGIYTENN